MSSPEPANAPTIDDPRADDQSDIAQAAVGPSSDAQTTPALGVPEGSDNTRPKEKKKEPISASREPGKSLLPFSRVQKVLKADKELPMVAKDATFLISIATEEFIKRLAEASQRVASREKRSTVQQRDVSTVVRKADEFAFIEDLMPFIAVEAPAQRKPKALAEKEDQAAVALSAPTLLDQYVSKKDGTDEPRDIIMNEDGTMYTGEMQDDT